jgi:pimeloyl-ACP methyl ester carboxylesterase
VGANTTYGEGITTSPRLPAGSGTIAVPGGDLAYEVLEGTSEPVTAIHGISSHRRLWSWLHAEAPDLTLVAPDLRGRADSVDVAGPYDLARHADDMALLLDALDLDRAPVLGMSMGAFVAMELRHRHPDRVASLVLVDGGFPLDPPPGLTPDNAELGFADRLGRLSRRWGSVDAYLDYFCSTTGTLLDRADPLLRHYVEHDLRDGLVRLSPDALVGDGRDTFFRSVPWQDVGVPVRWMHVQWGVGSDSTPMYSPDAVERYAPQCTTVVGLDGLDHAASIMSPAGAKATAALVREALE